MKQKKVGLIFLLAGILSSGCSNPGIDKLANCLTANGVKMYGAFWCPHCASQKEMFGSAYRKIDYVECSLPDRSGQTQICKDENIESYPTWEFKDKSKLTGEQTLEALAKKSGCELK